MLTNPPDRAMSASLFRHAAGAIVVEHAHPLGQLTVVTAGTMTLYCESGWWLAPPGRGIWVPPDSLHSARHAESSVHIRILLGPDMALGLPAQCQTISVSNLLRELALEAVQLSAAPEEENAILVARLIGYEASKPMSGPVLFVPQGRDPRLVRVINRLRLEPGEEATLDDLADLAASSPRTLARLFLSETGMTFGRWREHLRIVSAVDRLVRGQTITQTALELGYGSPSSFTTMFTRILGMPPARYLKEMREGSS